MNVEHFSFKHCCASPNINSIERTFNLSLFVIRRLEISAINSLNRSLINSIRGCTDFHSELSGTRSVERPIPPYTERISNDKDIGVALMNRRRRKVEALIRSFVSIGFFDIGTRTFRCGARKNGILLAGKTDRNYLARFAGTRRT